MDMTDMVAEGLAPGPDGMLLRFFYDAAKNERASIAEGRAIFDTVLCVDVITPGQKSSTPRFELERVWSDQSIKALGLNEPSMKSYKYNQFVEQIDKFKRLGENMDMGGTPLKEWPRIDRGLLATLVSSHIHTVEQLAGLSDTNLANIGLGARDLREQARSFLEMAGGSKDVSQLTDKLSTAERELKDTRDGLRLANQQIAEMQRAINEMGSADTPKRKAPLV